MTNDERNSKVSALACSSLVCDEYLLGLRHAAGRQSAYDLVMLIWSDQVRSGFKQDSSVYLVYFQSSSMISVMSCQ